MFITFVDIKIRALLWRDTDSLTSLNLLIHVYWVNMKHVFAFKVEITFLQTKGSINDLSLLHARLNTSVSSHWAANFSI